MADYATLDGILAREDATIYEVFAQCKDLVKEELNSIPLYYLSVRLMGYTEVGIRVCNEEGKVIGEYVSRNDKVTGKIEEIVGGEVTGSKTYFKNPDIIASVKERVLLDILQQREWVKKNKIKAFLKYKDDFELNKPIKDILLRRMFGSVVG